MVEKSINKSDVLLKEFEMARRKLREAEKKYLFVRGKEVQQSAIENVLGNNFTEKEKEK